MKSRMINTAIYIATPFIIVKGLSVKFYGYYVGKWFKQVQLHISKGELAEAVPYLRALANNRCPYSKGYLGHFYLHGLGELTKNEKFGLTLLRQSAYAKWPTHFPFAKFHLGKHLIKSKEQAEQAEGIRLIEAAYKAGMEEAGYLFGFSLLNGINGAVQNIPRAKKIFTALANINTPTPGDLYLAGICKLITVPHLEREKKKTEAEALNLLKQAGEAGQVMAKTIVAMFNLYGSKYGSVQQKPTKAFTQLSLAETNCARFYLSFLLSQQNKLDESETILNQLAEEKYRCPVGETGFPYTLETQESVEVDFKELLSTLHGTLLSDLIAFRNNYLKKLAAKTISQHSEEKNSPSLTLTSGDNKRLESLREADSEASVLTHKHKRAAPLVEEKTDAETKEAATTNSPPEIKLGWLARCRRTVYQAARASYHRTITGKYRQIETHFKNNQYAAAVKLCLEVKDDSNPTSLYVLAFCYRLGEGGLTRNPTEAIRYCRLAAEAGNHLAEHQLAQHLFKGEMTEANPSEGMQWLEKAANHGNINAMIELAQHQFNGTYGPPDWVQATRWYWFLRHAGNNLNNTLLPLGKCYLFGKHGITRDVAEAEELLSQANDIDPTGEALVLLGLCKLMGTQSTRGAEAKSIETEYISFIKQAEKKNNAIARIHLGLLHLFGSKHGNVQSELSKAKTFFENAADSKLARYLLAFCLSLERQKHSEILRELLEAKYNPNIMGEITLTDHAEQDLGLNFASLYNESEVTLIDKFRLFNEEYQARLRPPERKREQPVQAASAAEDQQHVSDKSIDVTSETPTPKNILPSTIPTKKTEKPKKASSSTHAPAPTREKRGLSLRGKRNKDKGSQYSFSIISAPSSLAQPNSSDRNPTAVPTLAPKPQRKGLLAQPQRQSDAQALDSIEEPGSSIEAGNSTPSHSPAHSRKSSMSGESEAVGATEQRALDNEEIKDSAETEEPKSAPAVAKEDPSTILLGLLQKLREHKEDDLSTIQHEVTLFDKDHRNELKKLLDENSAKTQILHQGIQQALALAPWKFFQVFKNTRTTFFLFPELYSVSMSDMHWSCLEKELKSIENGESDNTFDRVAAWLIAPLVQTHVKNRYAYEGHTKDFLAESKSREILAKKCKSITMIKTLGIVLDEKTMSTTPKSGVCRHLEECTYKLDLVLNPGRKLKPKPSERASAPAKVSNSPPTQSIPKAKEEKDDKDAKLKMSRPSALASSGTVALSSAGITQTLKSTALLTASAQHNLADVAPVSTPSAMETKKPSIASTTESKASTPSELMALIDSISIKQLIACATKNEPTPLHKLCQLIAQGQFDQSLEPDAEYKEKMGKYKLKIQSKAAALQSDLGRQTLQKAVYATPDLLKPERHQFNVVIFDLLGLNAQLTSRPEPTPMASPMVGMGMQGAGVVNLVDPITGLAPPWAAFWQPLPLYYGPQQNLGQAPDTPGYNGL